MEENTTCMACYRKVNADYVYCFMCNRKKEKLEYCAKIKQNGQQCRFKTCKEFCFYHRKKEESKSA